MKCPKCGNTLSDSAKFCPKCGTKLKAPGSPASGNAPVKNRQQAQPRGSQQTQPVSPGRMTPQAQPVLPKRSNAPIIIAIIAVVLVLGGAAVGTSLFLLSRRQEKTSISSDVWSGADSGKTETETRSQAVEKTSEAPETTAAPSATTSPVVTTAPAQPAASETPAGVEGYILPDSSVRYLTDQDLIGLSSEQLRLARNEIYARHGRKFKDEYLQAYFNGQSWYQGTVEPDRFNDDALLNDVERKNLELIKAREAVLN